MGKVNTELRIVAENGRFYVYDTLSSGNCVCLGAFDGKEAAEEELKRLLKVETEQNKRKAA